MPSTRSGVLKRQEGVYVDGLLQLQRALNRAEGEVGKRLRKELREVANDVRTTARSYVKHTTGRHGGSGVRLGPSIRTSVTTTGASVYSAAPHAIVQDSGGWVGRKTAGHPHGSLLRRADVSHYMTEAVQDSLPYVSRRVGGMLEELGL